MLQKSYSEGICVEKCGPEFSNNFKSTCNLEKERSYCTSVYFVPKLIPKRTYLTVTGLSDNVEEIETQAFATYNRAFKMSNGSVKSYESSISIDQKEQKQMNNGLEVLDGVQCFQNVELVPILEMKKFSESINIFPEEKTKSFKSNIAHDDCYLKKNYIVGLEVQKVREVELFSSGDGDGNSFISSVRITPAKIANGDVKMNGECDDFL